MKQIISTKISSLQTRTKFSTALSGPYLMLCVVIHLVWLCLLRVIVFAWKRIYLLPPLAKGVMLQMPRVNNDPHSPQKSNIPTFSPHTLLFTLYNSFPVIPIFLHIISLPLPMLLLSSRCRCRFFRWRG